MIATVAGYAVILLVNVGVDPGPWPERAQELGVVVVGLLALAIEKRRPQAATVAVILAVGFELVASAAREGDQKQAALLVMPSLVMLAGLRAGPSYAIPLSIGASVGVPLALMAGRALVGRPVLGLFTESSHLWVLVLVFLSLGVSTRAVWIAFHVALGLSEKARLRFLDLFDRVPDGLFELDPSGRIRMANPSAALLFRRDPDQSWQGVRLVDVLRAAGAPDDVDLAKAEPRSPFRVALAGQVRRVFEITVGDELGGSGRLVVVRDVSEREACDERMRHAQRLEMVGQLAGGVAHDFNNLLTAIGGNAAMLISHADPEVRVLAEEILHAQSRGATLTRQLLAFGRREVRRPERLDLGDALVDIAGILRRMLGERHPVHVTRLSEAWVVVDRLQLEQVVLNLVVNARDAMASGGRVDVRIRVVGRDEALAAGSALTGERQALLEVSDTGVGIPDALRATIFDPFFTTKPAGQGTGLGLSTVSALVQESAGEVTVESTPGRGSTFRVWLPLADAADGDASASAGQRPAVPRGQRERVLVVDDDRAVATLAARVLKKGGYEVTVAHDAAGALQHDAEVGPFDVVVTDVVMPGLSGTELAAVLRARRATQRVLFISGYFDPNSSDGVALNQAADLLRKPFSPDDLLRRVRAALDG